MSTTTIPVTEAKNKLTYLLRNIRMMWDRIIITKNGKNDAVLMSYEEYESWVETLSLSEEEKDAIIRGRESMQKGESVSLDDLI